MGPLPHGVPAPRLAKPRAHNFLEGSRTVPEAVSSFSFFTSSNSLRDCGSSGDTGRREPQDADCAAAMNHDSIKERGRVAIRGIRSGFVFLLASLSPSLSPSHSYSYSHPFLYSHVLTLILLLLFFPFPFPFPFASSASCSSSPSQNPYFSSLPSFSYCG